MEEIVCAKCGGYVYVDTSDFMQAEGEESSEDGLVFRFTQACEGEVENYNEDDSQDWDACDNSIDVVKYATVQSHMDIEQEED